MLQTLGENNFLPTPENSYNYKASKRLEMPKLKRAAKALVAGKVRQAANLKASQTWSGKA